MMFHKFAIVILTFVAGAQCYLDSKGLCTTQEMTCSDTCSSIAYCPGGGIMPVLLGCHGEKPYCNMGKCTDSYNPYCNKPNNQLFYCPEEDGTYPDPLDCNKFHICLNGTSYTSECAYPGLVFSTETLSCVRESKQHQCGKAMCRTNGTWALYSTDPRYAFYFVNPMTTTMVKRCKENYVFNVHTSQCEFKCPREGLFKEEDSNPASYIECSLLFGDDYLVTKRNCPNDRWMGVSSIFDRDSSQCVLNNIQPTTPTTEVTNGTAV